MAQNTLPDRNINIVTTPEGKRMFEEALQKEAAKMSLKIPGLIAKEKSNSTRDRNLYEEHIKQWQKEGKSDEFTGAEIADANSVTHKATISETELLAMWGKRKADTPYLDSLSKPHDPNWINNKFYEPFGYPQPQPQPLRVQKPYNTQSILDELARQGVKLPKPKSAFEEMLDMMFSRAEREQFLMDMGYELEQEKDVPGISYKITRKLADGTVKTITNSLDDLFLKEVTVKFKNLLMAKATLKIKI